MSPRQESTMQRPEPSHRPRGYALIFVLILGVVLATLSAILLYSVGRDSAEGRQQQNAVRALYAAEAAVAVGIEQVRRLLDDNPTPDLSGITTPVIGEAEYPVFRVRYYDAATNTSSLTPPATMPSGPILTGPNAGLFASQIPIQVLASAVVDNARATVADAIRIDLIPVFQFAIFMDGDYELQNPAPIGISGRVHANGNFYQSGAGTNQITYRSPITVAGRIANRSTFASSSNLTANNTARVLTAAPSTFAYFPSYGTTPLPRPTDAQQAAFLASRFGTRVLDGSGGQGRLEVPITITGRTACVNTAACPAGQECAKRSPADATGICMERIASRPDMCGNGQPTGARPNFAQSPAIELIRRPAALLSETGLYNDGQAPGSAFREDFGPRPADGPDTGTDVDDVSDVVVDRNVPVMNIVRADDDQGAAHERFYWKADIRIVDGIWYRRDSNTPVFDPETWDFGGPFSANNVVGNGRAELGYKFARVQRYSWWWDARETRVYDAAGNRIQRGLQIRASDFDVAAFNELLLDGQARALLFNGGVVPSQGVIVYISETYDPHAEDVNTTLPRAANVRNFLNLPIMENHLDGATLITPVAPTKGAGAPHATPTARGFYPSILWGRHAPVGFRSLTPPQRHPFGVDGIAGNGDDPSAAAQGDTTFVAAEARAFYRDPLLMLQSNAKLGQGGVGFECQEPVFLTAAPLPTATTRVLPPCIQSGATPRGPENAVRIVRAQNVPMQGLTIATDNRLYLHGDVNAVSTGGTNMTTPGPDGVLRQTRQGVAGKVAVIADSITLLSSRFSDRFLQRGGVPGDALFINRRARFTAVDDGIAPPPGPAERPWVREAPAEDGTTEAGRAPNLCTLGKNLPTGGVVNDARGTLPPGFPADLDVRKAVATRYNTSLLMGDVPACIDAGDQLGNPSGGVNNFPRFAENQEDVDNIIFGSMVSLFRSERGNARFLSTGMGNDFENAAMVSSNWVAQRKVAGYEAWEGGGRTACVYYPPTRVWSFDEALQQPGNLPPGTPRVFDTQRLRWVRR
jgi:type II secretory pathway pseudopilin PulG